VKIITPTHSTPGVYRNGCRAAERLTWECEKDGVDAGKLKP
jgi:hypothetical protein